MHHFAPYLSTCPVQLLHFVEPNHRSIPRQAPIQRPPVAAPSEPKEPPKLTIPQALALQSLGNARHPRRIMATDVQRDIFDHFSSILRRDLLQGFSDAEFQSKRKELMPHAKLQMFNIKQSILLWFMISTEYLFEYLIIHDYYVFACFCLISVAYQCDLQPYVTAI